MNRVFTLVLKLWISAFAPPAIFQHNVPTLGRLREFSDHERAEKMLWLSAKVTF